jgi:hypothetical protein
MIHIAIDNGFYGGIGVLSENGQIIETHIMPILKSTKTRTQYNVSEIVKIFESLKERFENEGINVILEKAIIIPISGKISVASTHKCMGLFEGILTAMKIPFQIVHAKTWQKIIFKDMPKGDTKINSILFCQRKFPNEDFRATKRCKNISDGLTDSTCMAYYSFLQHSQ